MGIKISELMEVNETYSTDCVVVDNGVSTTKAKIGTVLNDVNASISSLNTKLNGLSLWVGTQAQYDAIATKDPTTIYHILES